jgi:hypothetical protein
MNLDWMSFLLGVAALVVVEFVALLVVAGKAYSRQKSVNAPAAELSKGKK